LLEVKNMERKEREKLDALAHAEEYRALARAMLHP
jgi:hypothetical protein